MKDIAAIILAGGRSSRMGGGDKCLLPLGPDTVLAEIIGVLSPQSGPMVLSANGDPSRFEPYRLPVAPDRMAGFHGPLAGIEAGLSWVQDNCPHASYAVTVPGDTPFIPARLVEQLVQGRGEHKMAVATSSAGLHPVAGLWPVAMVGELQDALERGHRRASQFVRDQDAAEVPFAQVEIAGTSLDPFFNINTPDDLDLARDLVRRRVIEAPVP